MRRSSSFAVVITIIMLLHIVMAEQTQNVTREDALKAIQQAEQAIQEMVEAGFSVEYVNDTLMEAKKAFQRAEFAEILRTQAEGELAEKARQALEGLNWKGFTYDEVLKYTEEIMKRKEWAFQLNDKIMATEIKAKEYSALGVNVSEAMDLINQSKVAFEEERYEDAESLIQKADDELEEARAQPMVTSIALSSGRGFVEKHWKSLTVVAVVGIACSMVVWKKYRKMKLKAELEKLKLEKEVIE